MNTVDKTLISTKSGLKIFINDLNSSPFHIPEPRWIPDKECKYCVKCQKKFDPIKRKHHCRRCGRIFCNDCSSSKRPLPRMCFVDPVRHCTDCTSCTDIENKFFLRRLHSLTAGATFLLEMDDLESQVCICTLSADNKFIICDIFEDNRTIENVNIDSIISYDVKPMKEAGYYMSVHPCCIPLVSENGTNKSMGLKVDGSSSIKTSSIQWIVALKEGLNLLKQNRS